MEAQSMRDLEPPEIDRCGVRATMGRSSLPLVTPLGAMSAAVVLAVVLFMGRGLSRRPEAPDQHIAFTHHSHVISLAYSPDGKYLAWEGWDGSLAMFDPRPRGAHGMLAFPNRGKVPQGLAFFPDGSTLCSSYADGRVRFWDVGARRERAGDPVDGIPGSRFALSADGKWLAVVTGERIDSVELRDGATGRLLGTLGTHAATIRSLSFAVGGPTLATGDTDGVVKLWDVLSRREVASLPASPIRGEPITSLAFSDGGRYLAASIINRHVTLYDLPTRRPVAELGQGGVPTFAVAFARDGRTLVAAGGQGSIEGWDVVSRTRRFITRGEGYSVYALGFSPDGRQLASAGSDGAVRLWEFDAERQVLR